MSFVNRRGHYCSLHDLLASQERVPCTFVKDVAFIGGLDPRSENTTIEKGTSLELPYWLGQVVSDEKLANMEFPKVFGDSYRDILKADATVVDLSKLSKFFYEFGKMLSDNRHRDSEELSNTLIQSFIDRFRQVSDWAQSSDFEVAQGERLDNLEKALFQRGKKAHSDLLSWLTEGVGHISTSELVKVHKKRKLLAQEFNLH